MKISAYAILVLPLLVYASWEDKYTALFKDINNKLDHSIQDNRMQHDKLMTLANKKHEEMKTLIDFLSTQIGNETEKEKIEYVGNLVKSVENKFRTWKDESDLHNLETQNKLTKNTEELKNNILGIFDKYEMTKNCYELYQMGSYTNGVYVIKPENMEHNYLVYCDMEDGGWTVIQRRDYYADIKEDFGNTWEKFRDGFGEPTGELWLGNEIVHQMTKNVTYELKVQVTDFKNESLNVTYREFYLGSEEQNYTLHIGDPAPNQRRYPFLSTYDPSFVTEDNNECSEDVVNGWWYDGDCQYAYLNGRHSNVFRNDCITLDQRTPLSNTVMKIKPRTLT